MKHPIQRAFETDCIETFLGHALPPAWQGVAARILESGATMTRHGGLWCPGWTQVPLTVRGDGEDDRIMWTRSVMYRVHDCLHNLWPQPHPEPTPEGRIYYKRTQMAGEVAVLTIVEYEYGAWLGDTYPDLRPAIEPRVAVGLRRGLFSHLTLEQIAHRITDILHMGKDYPWAGDDQVRAWMDYYGPMLAADRSLIDQTWAAITEAGWQPPKDAPTARFGSTLTGRETTAWMLADFHHHIASQASPDWGLVAMNRKRREAISLPAHWAS